MSNIVIIGAGEFLKGCLETLNEVCPYTRPTEMLMNRATGNAFKVEDIPQHRKDSFIPFLTIVEIEDWLKRNKLFLVRPGITPEGKYRLEIDGKEPYAGFTEIVNHPREITRRQILKHNLEYLITIKV